jgi:membrane fusion protein, multidrug efflux system
VTEAEAGVLVAESQLAQARASAQQADATLRGSQTAPDQVKQITARAAAAQAQVKQAKAALQQAELNVQYTTVTAPAAGVVSRKGVEVGQVIQPGQPLFAVIPLENVWVTANFKETQLKHMRAGQRAEVEVDSYGGKTFTGHVDSISPATGARFSLLPPENATGNFVKVVQRVPVKIVLDAGQDPEHRLRAGMSVVPTVYTK